LTQGFADHPVAEFDRQFAAVDHVQKFAGKEQAAGRMVPANQGFRANHNPQAHIDLGLVVKGKLAFGQGLADLLQFIPVKPGPAVVFRVEQMVAIAPGLFGGIHRLVGVTQQGVGIRAVLRVERDADTGRNVDAVLVDLEGPG
jgi:hypothetical protein